jgi:ureidoacrylate peracid hydrolase
MLLDVGRAALVAVDLQRAFCLDDGSVARQGRDVSACRQAAERCAALAETARGCGLTVIWVRMVLHREQGDGGLLTTALRPGLGKIGALREGTPDVELIPQARVQPEDFVIDKPRLSAFYGSRLDAVLRARRIETLIVGGVTTSMCVESTVRDAGQRDHSTFVVADACGDFDPARHEASLAAMAFGFARVISYDQAVQAMQSRGAEF